MYETISIDNGRQLRAIGADVQAAPMSTRYRITDPVRLSAQLADAGFDTRIVSRGKVGKLTRGGVPWRAIVLATEPETCARRGDETYRRQVGFLCSHTGRDAFAAQVGVRADGCLNQFQFAPVRIWHTDPEIDAILADPADFARRLIGRADLALSRLDSLRSIGYATDMLAALRSRPRLQRLTARALSRYWPTGGDTFWTGLQALTDTKSPSLVRLTSLALDEGWETTSAGEIPHAWETILN